MLNLIHEEIEPQNVRHIEIARRVLARTRGRHEYALPASQPAPGGHPGHAAVSDSPSRLRVVRHARELVRGAGVPLARPVAVNSTYTITEADLDNLDRLKGDLADLLAPLNQQDPEVFSEGCRLMARLDRVIRRAQATEQRPDDAA